MAPIVKDFQALLLTQKGEVKQTKLPIKQEITFEYIKKFLKSKNEIDIIATYESGSTILFLFGAVDGKSGTENQHELPPPHDTVGVFGDILLIAATDKEWKQPISITVAQYEKFYQAIFDGLDEEDGENEDEEIEDVVVDDEVEDDEEVPEEDENEEDEEEKVEEGEIEEEVDIPVRKVQNKKKTVSAASAALLNTGRGRQQQLIQTVGFKELSIDSKDDSKKKNRTTIRNIITTLITSIDAVRLEEVIYKASFDESERLHVVCHWDNPLFETIYKTIARRVITNLNKDSYVKNTRLIQRLNDNEFTMEELACKNSYELYPEFWKELSDRQIMREQKLLEGNKGMATDQFKCHGCGKRETTYYEMQTRSADEPMTIFITCLNCGKRWRQ